MHDDQRPEEKNHFRPEEKNHFRPEKKNHFRPEKKNHFRIYEVVSCALFIISPHNYRTTDL